MPKKHRPNQNIRAALRAVTTALALALPDVHVRPCAAENAHTTTTTGAAIKNPFAYATPNGDELIPVSTGRLPTGIRLASVLIFDNGDAIAALRLPGEKAPVFVRVDDLISIDAGHETLNPKAEARPAAATPVMPTHEPPLYLLIRSISATGVEVAPRVRPTELHLIR